MCSELRVLFGPYETAGQMWNYASGLRALGIDTTTLTFLSHAYEYPVDLDLSLSSETTIDKIISGATILKHYPRLYADHDIFHFWAGRSLFPRHADIPLYKLRDKKVVINYRGSNARLGSIAKRDNPYEHLMATEYNDQTTKKYLKKASKYVDVALVPDHELYPSVAKYYDQVEVIRRAIDTDAIEPSYPNPEQEEPLIAHAPSHRGNKGTRFVLEALEMLEQTHEFQFKLIENVPHEEVIQILQKADIVVDQLLRGTHGVLSVEAMAAGTPTLCYLRDDLIDTFPGSIPIVNANPDTIKSVLADLIQSPELRHELGIESREYVEEYHDHEVIGEELLEVYESI